MFKDMGNELDKKMFEYKKNIDEYKEKLGIDEILKDYEDTEFNLDEWFKEKGKILTTPKVKIGLVNKSTNYNPEFATNGASGFDLRADLPKDKTIIKYLFILEVDTYLYFVFNKQVEEIYLINTNEKIFFKILKKTQKDNITEYITTQILDDNKTQTNDIFYLQETNDDTKFIIGNKTFSNKYDSDLYKLFFQISKLEFN